MASAKENGGKSSDCNCVRDKIVPPLQEDLHVLGITFATVKQQENACRKMLVDVMRDGIAIAAKIKASQDDNEKLELRQQLCDNSARKIYFEERLNNLEGRASYLYVQQARLQWRKDQAENHVYYH